MEPTPTNTFTEYELSGRNATVHTKNIYKNSNNSGFKLIRINTKGFSAELRKVIA